MLRTRVIAALIFAPALAVIVWVGGLTLEIACVIISMLALWEFLDLSLGKGQHYAKAFAYAAGLLVCFSTLKLPFGIPLSTVWPCVTLVLMFSALTRPEPIEESMRRTGLLMLGVAYCTGLLPYLYRLRVLDAGLGLAMSALFCTWAADTGAYFAGRVFGKRPLYARVSPKKTIEGLVGGLVAAIAAALAFRAVMHIPIRVADSVVIGAIAALFGVAGDLCESLLKRSVGAKDSSSLIPGHGGVLDRFDAVMFVAPAVYLYIDVFVF
ncbi:MAG: phosphatidate cytidylyltransferase [Clostridia bacterium]|nr:phosphatidate cytidylyltransferase [Deltaproteobacteria bacterium]